MYWGGGALPLLRPFVPLPQFRPMPEFHIILLVLTFLLSGNTLKAVFVNTFVNYVIVFISERLP